MHNVFYTSGKHVRVITINVLSKYIKNHFFLMAFSIFTAEKNCILHAQVFVINEADLITFSYCSFYVLQKIVHFEYLP